MKAIPTASRNGTEEGRSSTAYWGRSPGDAPAIPTSVLVKEVYEVLSGDLREETIEAILAFGDPGTDER